MQQTDKAISMYHIFLRILNIYRLKDFVNLKIIIME